MSGRTYYAPHGGLPGQTAAADRPRRVHRGLCRHPQGRDAAISSRAACRSGTTRGCWILSRPLSGFAETFSQYIMEVAPGGGSDRPEPDDGAEGALFVVEGELTVMLAGKSHVMQPGGFAFIPPASGWTVRNESGDAGALPLDPQGLRVRSTASTRRRRSSPTRTTSRRSPMPGHRRPLGDDALRRPGRSAPRHARHHRHAGARRRHPVCRDPCHGARPLCAGRQGGLPPQPGLGRGRGRRLYVAARLLPAGLLCRRPRQFPLSALQGRQPPHEARQRRHLAGRPRHDAYRRTAADPRKLRRIRRRHRHRRRQPLSDQWRQGRALSRSGDGRGARPERPRADLDRQGHALRIPAEADHGRAPSVRQPGLHPAVAAPVPGGRLP